MKNTNYFYAVRISISSAILSEIFKLVTFSKSYMQENKSGCFFLNTVYILVMMMMMMFLLLPLLLNIFCFLYFSSEWLVKCILLSRFAVIYSNKERYWCLVIDLACYGWIFYTVWKYVELILLLCKMYFFVFLQFGEVIKFGNLWLMLNSWISYFLKCDCL